MRYGIVQFVGRVLAVVAVLAGSGRADAGFMGSTLSYEYLFPNSGSPFDNSTFVVSGAIERSSLFSGNTGTDYATVDVSDSAILVDFYQSATWSSVAFNGFHLADTTNNVPAITGVTVNPATNMSGFSASRVTFDANNIFVNWESLPFNPSTVVQLDVTFAGGGSVATPLPPTLLAGFLGMTMLAGVRRLRRG